jgi:hypothetical protein
MPVRPTARPIILPLKPSPSGPQVASQNLVQIGPHHRHQDSQAGRIPIEAPAKNGPGENAAWDGLLTPDR